jgi:hypothetical protein
MKSCSTSAGAVSRRFFLPAEHIQFGVNSGSEHIFDPIRGQSTFSINGSEYNNMLATADLIDFCAANGGTELASRIVHKKVL